MQLRTKSFGELTSGEYQDLVTKMWEAAETGDAEGVALWAQMVCMPRYACEATWFACSFLHYSPLTGLEIIAGAGLRRGFQDSDVCVCVRFSVVSKFFSKHSGSLAHENLFRIA